MTGNLVVVLDEWVRPRDAVPRLRQARLGVWHAAKALAETVAGEERDFTREEQDQWDLMMEQMTRLDSLLRIQLA